MKSHFWRSSIVLVLATGLVIFSAALAVASQGKQETRDTASAEEVKKEAADTYEALKRYSVEQKDEAVAAAKKQIEQLDAHLETVEDYLEANWQEMSRTARQQTREVMKGLREQRQEVAEWYGGIQHSSADAWDKVKEGFSRAYDELEEAVWNVKEEITDSSENTQ